MSTRSALVIVAHPDDADFGAAGTLATWADDGWDITLVCVTRGDAGGVDAVERDTMPRIREAEQRAAAGIVGVSRVLFLEGYRDGHVEPSRDLQRDLVRIIRQVQPDRVLLQSPERWYDFLHASHPDHLAAGEAAMRAIYPAAENPHAFPELLEEGLTRFVVPEIWLMAHPSANEYVDITDTFERKIAALKAHESQTGHLGDRLEANLRQGGVRMATEAGLPDGHVAERFYRIKML